MSRIKDRETMADFLDMDLAILETTGQHKAPIELDRDDLQLIIDALRSAEK